MCSTHIYCVLTAPVVVIRLPNVPDLEPEEELDTGRI